MILILYNFIIFNQDNSINIELSVLYSYEKSEMKNNKNTAYNILLRLLRGKFMTLNNNFLKIKRIKINVLESHLNMVLKGQNKF